MSKDARLGSLTKGEILGHPETHCTKGTHSTERPLSNCLQIVFFLGGCIRCWEISFQYDTEGKEQNIEQHDPETSRRGSEKRNLTSIPEDAG